MHRIAQECEQASLASTKRWPSVD